ncbi:hypothetical protein ebA5558 [Aromatoleum aromaticum EbN1]|uniref:Uncharacterized protein n=1 Tax=Aromatoleum aromaticum (strain DSM 19018 / LMG 30748 / EbN1) TaxID=76114 RepID=Q5P073_AROAE|nr:hypothetical protein ebA5558 [Aromatoleum aromaticum EbN1]
MIARICARTSMKGSGTARSGAMASDRATRVARSGRRHAASTSTRCCPSFALGLMPVVEALRSFERAH